MNSKDTRFPVETDSLEYDRRLFRNRDTFDSQKLIRDILASPSDDGPVADPSSGITFKKLVNMNVDMQTRIVMRMALQAASGDVKSAEFLFKYGGLEPPKERTMEIQTPTFIDDIECEFSEESEDEDDDSMMLPSGEEDEDEEDDGIVMIEPTETL